MMIRQAICSLLVSVATCALLTVSAADARTIAPRIINGQIVSAPDYAARWAWIAALVDPSQATALDGQFCGASLVGPRLVMTAAHCVENESASSIDVVIGQSLLSASTGNRYDVSRLVLHPQWNTTTVQYDMALLELATVASETPVSFVTSSDGDLWGNGSGLVANAATGAWIAGWGNICSEGCSATYPDDLREANIPIIADSTCLNAGTGGFSDLDTASMFCAGILDTTPMDPNSTDGVDTCQGDSGGPLIVGDGSGGWKVAGITSWGDGCAQQTFGVYTRVGELFVWVTDQINCGFGAGASLCSATPADATAPSGPGRVTLRTRTRRGLSFRWGAATDNVGVVRYVVYRKAGSRWLKAGTTPPGNRVFTKGGLRRATKYFFRVRARDAAGNVGPIAAGTFKTRA